MRERAFAVLELYVDSLKRHSSALERGPEAAAAHVEAEQKKDTQTPLKRAGQHALVGGEYGGE